MPSAIALLVALVLPALERPSLDVVLTRAGAYATAFHHDAGRLIAQESLVEMYDWSSSSRGVSQETVSEFAMIADKDGTGWRAFRNVLSVDRTAIPESVDGALARALSEGSLDTAERMTARSQARLLRPAVYFHTAPPVALMVLLPSEQPRFVFTDRGQKKVDGVTVTVVRFKEVRGPGFFRDSERNDMAMTGEFWIEPGTGAVLRSSFSVEGPGLTSRTDGVVNHGPTRVSVETNYRTDAALGIAVPLRMRLTVSRDTAFGISQGIDGGSSNPRRQELDCVSTYSHYRRLPGVTDRTP